MKRKKRLWLTIVMTVLAFVGIGGYMAETAYAYTFYPASFQYGDLALNPENQPQVDGGSSMKIENPGTEPNLAEAVVHAFIAHAQVAGDGQGNWQIPDLDIEGSTSNDGYPMIGGLGSDSYDINSFVSRLDGNLSYVQGYIQAHGGTTTASSFSTNSIYDLVDLDTVVLTSGATMTVHNTPTGQYDSEGNQILYGQYTITPTAPPTAESIRISDGSSGSSGTVTEGDPLDISVTSQQNVDNGAYTHHYDSVKVVSSSGTTTWLVGT
ncbi:hypothetical protein [Alicyclobacillus sp. SP_1]|uniref:hypothetical protein n=1 Tax=Alicyclobacillus sp. SP_1 TaxID=2942475 RepID=UPI00215810D8|nr:hypothetical protein [Alicyclobacillus sp. SP_1]